MKRAAFQWDQDNIAHIVRHDVEPYEAEQVLDDDPLILRTRDKKYLAYGQADSGRYLLIVFVWKSSDLIRVITARDLTNAEKKRLRRTRR